MLILPLLEVYNWRNCIYFSDLSPPLYFHPFIVPSLQAVLLRSPKFLFIKFLWCFLLPLSQRTLTTTSLPSPANCVSIN